VGVIQQDKNAYKKRLHRTKKNLKTKGSYLIGQIFSGELSFNAGHSNGTFITFFILLSFFPETPRRLVLKKE